MAFTIIRDTKNTIFAADAAQARHEHDCECCQFNGMFNEFDLYYCPNCDDGTLIARYGVDGDYISTPLSLVDTYLTKANHPIAAAYTAYKANDADREPITIGDLIRAEMARQEKDS